MSEPLTCPHGVGRSVCQACVADDIRLGRTVTFAPPMPDPTRDAVAARFWSLCVVTLCGIVCVGAPESAVTFAVPLLLVDSAMNGSATL